MIAWARRQQRGDRCQTFVFTFLNVSPETIFLPSLSHINKSLHCHSLSHFFLLSNFLILSPSVVFSQFYTHHWVKWVGTDRHGPSNQNKKRQNNKDLLLLGISFRLDVLRNPPARERPGRIRTRYLNYTLTDPPSLLGAPFRCLNILSPRLSPEAWKLIFVISLFQSIPRAGDHRWRVDTWIDWKLSFAFGLRSFFTTTVRYNNHITADTDPPILLALLLFVICVCNFFYVFI